MSIFQVGACCSSATGCSSFEGGESEKIEWCFITKSSCFELCWSSSLPQFTEMFFDWRGWVNYPPVSIRIDRINSRIDISPENPPRAKIDSFQCSLLKRGGRGGGLYWLVQHGDLYMYCVWLYLGSRECSLLDLACIERKTHSSPPAPRDFRSCCCHLLRTVNSVKVGKKP